MTLTQLFSNRRAGITALCVIAALFGLRFAALNDFPLIDPSEGRYAEISREMAHSGNWVMPELVGPATCERLKADPATAAMPVIFLTAKAQESAIARGLALGAKGYLTKPFDPLTLGRQLQELLER